MERTQKPSEICKFGKKYREKFCTTSANTFNEKLIKTLEMLTIIFKYLWRNFYKVALSKQVLKYVNK